MKNSIFALLLISFVFTSCRSNKDDCIDSMMDEKGYSYKSAKEACEDAQIDSNAR